GKCEEVLGGVLKGVRRASYVLASKVFWPTGDQPTDRGLSRKHILETCAASLERLGTDYLDILYCHRYDPEVPLEETVLAMEDLISQGKILYWGVSCWTSEQIREAVRIATRYPPAVNQPPYNMFERGIEKDVLETCGRHGLGVAVFSPIAQGFLTGKYLDGRPPGSRGADEKTGKFMAGYFTPKHEAVVRKLVGLAKETGITPTQLALGWCLRRPEVTSVIVGATKVDQLEENAKAGPLPDDVLARVEEIAKDAPLSE
ncbi:MAG: aldo/keto reductase, partial [Planctomycetota bacterium]